MIGVGAPQWWLRGSAAAAGGSGTWTTVYTMNETRAFSSGWASYDIRNVYALSEFSATGGTKMRVTFLGPPSGGEDFSIVEAYVGEAAGAGDAYDFAAAPDQIQFGGSNGTSIAAGNTELSDEINIGKAATGNLIISIKVGGAADDTGTRSSTGMEAGSAEYYKSGGDASEVDASSYSDGTGAYGFIGVEKIELFI